jgi:pimeloyl-ACP methyl ester carboxylesterase
MNDVADLASLTPRVLEWRISGEAIDVGGDWIFVRRSDGHGPLLLFLHGFPSSSYDWRHTLAGLGDNATLALDFLGFGLSDKPPDATYTLFKQADIVERLAANQPRPVVVVAHDMGTSVATELLARDIEGTLSFKLAGLLLLNGSVIIERASMTWAQKALRSPLGAVFARLSNRRMFVRQFARLFSPSYPLSEDEAEDQWDLWRRAGGAQLAHRLIRYVSERQTYAARWHGALRDWQGELWLAWGMRDPVATPNVLASLRQLRPGAPVTELFELGHYPQIEQPTAIARLVAQLASGSRASSPD